jgi:hypothetical protein
MKAFLPVAALVLTAAACTAPTDDAGGTDENLTQIDWKTSKNASVVLLVASGGRPVCQGTLIRRDVVLTSATCVSRQPIAAFFGKVRRGEGLEGTIRIEEAKSHPGWFKESEAEFGCRLSAARDVALLRLAAPIAAASPAGVSYEDPTRARNQGGLFGAHQLLDGVSTDRVESELRERTVQSNQNVDPDNKTSFTFWGTSTYHHSGGALLVNGTVMGVQGCTLRAPKGSGVSAVSAYLSMTSTFLEATLTEWKRATPQ